LFRHKRNNKRLIAKKFIFFYLSRLFIKSWSDGLKKNTNHLKKYIIIITIIGVKSMGQNEVGIIDFMKLYIGSIISAINFGLNLTQKSISHESITSAKIM